MNRVAAAICIGGLIAVAASGEPASPLAGVAPVAWRLEFRGDPAGELADLQRADYGGAVVDGDGNTYLVFGATHYRLTDPPPLFPRLHVGLAKFDPAGSVLWTSLIDEEQFDNVRGVGIALTSDGNIAVAGDLVDFGSGALVASFLPDGTRRWAHALDGSAFPLIAGGPNGAVTVATISGTDDKWRIVRYDAAGGTDFDVRYGANLSVSERPTVIETDTAGRTYVFGYGPDPVLVAFLATGAKAWNVPRTGAVYDLAPRLAGGVYTAGDGGVAVTAYDTLGGVVWQQTLDPTGQASRVLTDATGRVIVAGTSNTSVVTGVLEDDGDVVWTRTWGSPGRYGAGVSGLALDGAGGIRVAATGSAGTGNGVEVVTELLRYDASGTLLTIASIASRAHDNEQRPVLAFDGVDGVVFATQNSTPVKKRGEIHHALVVKSAGAAATVAGTAKVPKKLSFGTAPTASGVRQKTLKIKNSSKTATLVVCVDAATAPFSGGGGSYEIAPRKSLFVHLEFDPAIGGTAAKTLAIATSDPSHPALQLVLSGKGK